MSIIIIIPGFIAFYYAFMKSPHQAFVKVYVPILLFIPTYYTWEVPALPDPNAQQVAILAILGVWFLRGTPGWKFSFTDLLVFGFALTLIYSEYSNVGYKESQNFIASTIGAVIAPYVLAKALIEPAGLRQQFAKSIVIVLAIVTIFALFQTVTKSNYTLWQKVLGHFFGGQGWEWPTQYRWGLPRAAGPFGHAILAGIVMVVGYRIQRWLQWSKAWPQRPAQLQWLPIPLPTLLTITLFIGSLITLVRGPLSGAIVAAIILLIGKTKKRWTIFWTLVVLFVIVGIPAISWFINYASVDPALARNENQQTVAYRWQLIENYVDIANKRFLWGWGRMTWPKVPSQPSIDNYYLLIFLQHGMMGLGLLLALLLSMMTRLFAHAMLQPVAQPLGSSLGFTLFSIYIVIAWSIATVWLGEQTIYLLFLLLGWSEGYLLFYNQNLQKGTSGLVAAAPEPKFRFRRILS